MEDDGQSFIYQKFVAPSSNTVRFATALNRSVTGSMNDLIGHATGWLEYGDVSPHDLGFRLNDIPLSAIATSKSEKYRKPNDAFKRLADVQRGATRSTPRGRYIVVSVNPRNGWRASQSRDPAYSWSAPWDAPTAIISLIDLSMASRHSCSSSGV